MLLGVGGPYLKGLVGDLMIMGKKVETTIYIYIYIYMYIYIHIYM